MYLAGLLFDSMWIACILDYLYMKIACRHDFWFVKPTKLVELILTQIVRDRGYLLV